MFTLFLLGIISSVLGSCRFQWNINFCGACNRCAIVYQHEHCNGARRVIMKGNGHRRSIGAWNDQVSSIWVADRCKLQVFEHHNYHGKNHQFGGRNVYHKMRDFRHGGSWFWKTTWNDRISSWKCDCW